MSMIGVLIDNLNKSADEWNGSNMFELAHMCRDAADTIWQLRDDLQRANTERAALERRIDELCQENEQLRQELAIRESSEQEKVIDYLGKECADWEVQYLALAGENAKLRELVRALVYAIDPSDRATIICNAAELMAELGVEVDS